MRVPVTGGTCRIRCVVSRQDDAATRSTGGTESYIERLMYDALTKAVKPTVEIVTQYHVGTSIGAFRLDMALVGDEKTIGVECDGKEHHPDIFRDEVRDAAILGQSDVFSIWRFTGKAIRFASPSCVHAVSQCEPEFFTDDAIARLLLQLVRLATGGRALDWYPVLLPPRDMDPDVHLSITDITVRTKDSHAGRQHWRWIARRLEAGGITSIDAYIAAV